MIERRWLVQDRESKSFLGMGDDGDLDFFPYVNRAFGFESQEAATLSGLHYCDVAGYLVWEFLVEYQSVQRGASPGD